VDTWIKHAQNLQEDIDKSRKLASEIVQQAEADEARAAALQDKELHVNLLEKEIVFNAQLVEALQSIKRANDAMDRTVELGGEDKIADALKSLEGGYDTTPGLMFCC